MCCSNSFDEFALLKIEVNVLFVLRRRNQVIFSSRCCKSNLISGKSYFQVVKNFSSFD